MSYECYDLMSNRLNYRITLTISVNKNENHIIILYYVMLYYIIFKQKTNF